MGRVGLWVTIHSKEKEKNRSREESSNSHSFTIVHIYNRTQELLFSLSPNSDQSLFKQGVAIVTMFLSLLFARQFFF